MLPPGQHLKADGFRGFKVNDPLVVRHNLTIGDGCLDFSLQLDALLQLLVHRRVKEAVLRAPFGLGAIHRHVGLAENGLYFCPVTCSHCAIAIGSLVIDRDADADADLKRQGCEWDWFLNLIDNPSRQTCGSIAVRTAVHQNTELIAAEPRHRPMLRDGGHALGDDCSTSSPSLWP